MKKLILFLGLLFLGLTSFGQALHPKGVTIGENGSQIDSAKINGIQYYFYHNGLGFHTGGPTSYENEIIVAKSGGDYTDIQTAISAASSGDVVFIYSGTYIISSKISIKNGVDIIGIGNVIIDNSNISSTEPCFYGDGVDVNIWNLTIKGYYLFTIYGNSDVVFQNCILTSHTGSYDAKFIIENTSNVKILNSELDYIDNSYVRNQSNLKIDVNYARLGTITFEDSTEFSIVINNLYAYYTAYASAVFVLGEINPYNSAINGTSSSYNDTTDADYPSWVSHNEAGKVKGYYEVHNLLSQGGGGATLYQDCELTVNNSDFTGVDGASFRRWGGMFNVYNSAKLTINNSTFTRVAGQYGDYIVRLNNCKSRYDGDVLPYGDLDSVYSISSTYWPAYQGGSHNIEFAEFYNKDLIPLLIAENTSIDYMGMDAINGLSFRNAMKELEVNETYISYTTALPSSTGFETKPYWASATSYSAGDLIFHIGFTGDTIMWYVPKNYTSSADFNTDISNGDVRILFGANKQSNGYYQSLYYAKTDGWLPHFLMGEYHGGKYISRGSPIKMYHGNIKLKNCIINDYNSFWGWNTGSEGKTYTLYGSEAYKTTLDAGTKFSEFTDLTINGYIDIYDTSYLPIDIELDTNFWYADHTLRNISINGNIYDRAYTLHNEQSQVLSAFDGKAEVKMKNILLNNTSEPNYTYPTLYATISGGGDEGHIFTQMFKSTSVVVGDTLYLVIEFKKPMGFYDAIGYGFSTAFLKLKLEAFEKYSTDNYKYHQTFDVDFAQFYEGDSVTYHNWYLNATEQLAAYNGWYDIANIKKYDSNSEKAVIMMTYDGANDGQCNDTYIMFRTIYGHNIKNVYLTLTKPTL